MLRRVLRIIAWVVLGLLLFVSACALGAAVWLRSGSGHRFVGAKLAERASRLLAGTVEVGAVSGSIFRELVLHDVTVRDRDGATAASIDRAELRYSLFELLGERKHLGRVALSRPVVHLERRRALTLVSKRPTPKVTIEALEVDDGRVLAPSVGTTVEALDARARLVLGPSSTATLRSLTATVRRGAATRPLVAGGVARWSKQRIEVPGFELASQRSRVELHGRADRGGPRPRVLLSLDADLAADDLAALTPLEPRQPLALQLRANGTPADFTVDLRSDLPAALGIGAWPLYGHARVERGDGRLAIAPLSLRAGGNRLDAAVQRDGARTQARLDELTITPALAAALTPNAPTATVRLAGTLGADRRQAAARVQLRAGRGSARLDARLDRRTQALTAHLRTDGLSPHALTERAPDGAITAALAVDARLAGRRRGGTLRADVRGTLGGRRIRDGALWATAALGARQRVRLAADARLGPRRLRATFAAVRDGGAVEVPEAALELGQSQVQLSGRWSPERGALGRAYAHLEPDDVHALLPSQQPRGIIDLRLAADGPPAAVEAQLDADLGAGHARAAAHLDVPHQRGRLRAELVDVDTAMLGYGRRVRVSAALAAQGARDADGVTLDPVELRDGRIVWGSKRGRPSSLESLTVRGAAHLGAHDRVRLTELSGLWVQPRRTRPISGRGEARWSRDQRIRLDSAFVAGKSALAVSGAVGVARRLAARPMHLEAQLTVDPTLLAELAPRFAAGAPLQVGLEARGRLGDVRARGTATGLAGRRASLEARLHLGDEGYALRRLALRFGGSRLDADGALAHRRLRARLQAALSADDARLLAAALDPPGPLSLRADAAGPLQAIALRASLRTAEGGVRAAGELDAPRRRGRVRVVVDRLAPRALQQRQAAGQVSGQLAIGARRARDGLAGTLRLDRLRGELRSIPITNGQGAGRFAGKQLVVPRFSVSVPGAQAIGRAQGRLGGTFEARIGIHIRDALKLPAPFIANLFLGADQALVNGSVVNVQLVKQQGKKLQRHIDLVLPGERTLRKAFGGGVKE